MALDAGFDASVFPWMLFTTEWQQHDTSPAAQRRRRLLTKLSAACFQALRHAPPDLWYSPGDLAPLQAVLQQQWHRACAWYGIAPDDVAGQLYLARFAYLDPETALASVGDVAWSTAAERSHRYRQLKHDFAGTVGLDEWPGWMVAWGIAPELASVRQVVQRIRQRVAQAQRVFAAASAA